MKTIKVSEATGPALDWLVAKCEGHLEPTPYYDEMIPRVVLCDRTLCDKVVVRLNPMPQVYYKAEYDPSTNWEFGGPIIEREFLSVDYDKDWVYDPANAEPDDEPDNGDRWMAWPLGDQTNTQYGPTPLIAAMRCYVTSRLGEEAEVPDELA